MAQDEKVLVIERKVFEGVGIFNGLEFNVERYLQKIFAAGVPRFMDRSQAEKDPNYKQLIPYVIMSCNGRYLSYIRGRRAGEKRLVGNRSIGIGGHINPDDADNMPLFNANFYESYLAAVKREVEEEVILQTSYIEKVVALLNDESNEVGRVHLGIVHHWILDEPMVSRREQMITQLTFMTIEELENVRDTMETWSSLCLNGLAKIAEQSKTG